MRSNFIILILFFYSMQSHAQQVIPLYNGNIPGSIKSMDKETTETGSDGIVRVNKISIPTLTIYKPDPAFANGTAVIICPGGGYFISAIKHEGYDVAKLFASWGITSFVLKYRIPDDEYMIDKSTGPLQDVQQAVKYVRQNATNYKIDINKVGVMGFSAGGHLAASSGVHYNDHIIKNETQINLRPDFMILIYPVISFMDSIGHLGSRDNLLGKNISASKIKYFSNELQVNKNTPPCFLVHAGDDNVVNVQNSIQFYTALNKNGVPASLNIYEHGGHGFGMNNSTTTDQWTIRLKYWLQDNKWIK